ncbi:MAG TPA: helix-turn-helix domain-containing protein [Lacunisphaera sp.]|nr:helix-turn-helix domain-containing protein [Lacunisphaera sp.]
MTDILALQRAVWTSPRTAFEKLTLLAIIDFYSHSSQEPWPSVATLARRTGLGRTSVLGALATLEQDGVLVVRREFGRPNHYDLSHVPAALAPVGPADQSAARTGGELNACSHGKAASAEPNTGVSETVKAVRMADPSAARTGPRDGRQQCATRTAPVRPADAKEPKKEPKKEATRARVSPSLGEALELPVSERAKLVLTSAREAERLQPQDWSEVRMIAQAFGAAVGRERKLSSLAQDSGLRMVVALLAAAHSPEDLVWVASNVPKQRWWRESNRNHGLASLSPEVVARALEERDRSSSRGLPKHEGSRELSEERRLARNALLENAKAGQFGPEYQRRASDGAGLRQLANELEHLQRTGRLRAVVTSTPLASAGSSSEGGRPEPRELHASRSLAALMETILQRGPVKHAPAEAGEERSASTG